MKLCITGGGGFLGTAIVRQARARGDEVTSVSRSSYAHLEALGVRQVQADLGEESEAARAAIASAVEGAEVVLHTAAKAGVWGPFEAYHRANVVGTRQVLEATLRAGVPRFVHTSSPSVCFTGVDELDASNDVPLASTFLTAYPETKAAAERLVLAAAGDALSTCALRPHLIFGPGDPHLFPRLIERGRAKKLKRVGSGHNEVTVCFVENAAHAHLLAADSLSPSAPHHGQAYFIGQDEAVNLWDWLARVFEGLGLPPITGQVSANTARRAGAILEWVWKALRLSGEPPMTRFVAAQLATSHSYSMEPAKLDFGYVPIVDLDEATERAIAAFK